MAAIQISTATAWKIIGILGISVSLVWGAANVDRDVKDNSKAVTSLNKKSKRMAIGIRKNRSDIRYMILMQKATLKKLRVPMPAIPEPEILEFDAEVEDAR